MDEIYQHRANTDLTKLQRRIDLEKRYLSSESKPRIIEIYKESIKKLEELKRQAEEQQGAAAAEEKARAAASAEEAGGTRELFINGHQLTIKIFIFFFNDFKVFRIIFLYDFCKFINYI